MYRKFFLTVSLVFVTMSVGVVPKTEELAPLPQKKWRKRKPHTHLISFNFDNEDLVNVINTYAEKKQVNIVFPQGVNALTQKVTFHLQHKVTLAQASDYLDTFLNIAGYSKVPHGDDFIMIVKNDANIVRDTLPLFVNVEPEKLPKTEEYIRAIYYLENFKVPASSQGPDALIAIFNDMLSANKNFLFDNKSNAIIVTDKANTIASAMKIILELDKSGAPPSIELVQLFNTSADIVATLIKSQILAVGGNPQGGIRADVKSESGLFFNPYTRVVADSRTNVLILMGRESALKRIKELINELDQPEDSGESILHLYDLEYLDAELFGPVLQKIVEPRGGSSQSTKGAQQGSERHFEGVIIVGEAVKAVEKDHAVTGATGESILKGTVYRGGNRLVIACRSQDWQRIEQLIKDLDKPEPQVIIEMLIIDLDMTDERLLAAQLRNASGLNLPPGVNFQTTHAQGSILPVPQPGTPPTTLASDLLSAIPSLQTLSNLGGGSTFFSLNDPAGTGIWGLLQILQTYTTTKVLSHPFLVAVNNKRAEETVSTIRRDANNATVGSGGAVISNRVDVEAALKISIVPRVSSSERVNLQMSIKINRFSSLLPTDMQMVTREMHTDANLGNGQILVIGGLTLLNDAESVAETPLLSRIPLLGNLFKRSSKTLQEKTLMVFLSPTIIEPKIRQGINAYTKEKMYKCYYGVNDESLFSNLHDPITRMFFLPQAAQGDTKIDEYLSETQGDFVDLNPGLGKNKKR